MSNHIKASTISVCFVFMLVLAAFAQTPSSSPAPAPPPVNDIFLIDVANKSGQMTFGKPSKITEWHGYNNQPSVTPDGKFISVVRVEADGTQRLWKFGITGGKPSLVLEKIKPVGYQAWIDQNTLALYILGAAGKPSTLQIVDVRTEKAEVIAENIGRPLRLMPHQNKLSFVHKISAAEWIVKSFDLQTRQITTLIKTLLGSEDYAWTPAGVLLMGKDAKLFAWEPGKDTGWHEVADFSTAGLTGITRIAVSPKGNRIAIVAR